MARKDNPVIGLQDCFMCGSTVEIMLTREGAGCAMYLCDGRADDATPCNGQVRFGGNMTKKMKREAAEAERRPDNEETEHLPASTETGDGNDDEPTAEAKTDDSPGFDDDDDGEYFSY